MRSANPCPPGLANKQKVSMEIFNNGITVGLVYIFIDLLVLVAVVIGIYQMRKEKEEKK